MNRFDDSQPIVRGARDGGGRVHDLYLEPCDGEVVLSCPSAFWSVTLTPDQGDELAPAIQKATKDARQQVSP